MTDKLNIGWLFPDTLYLHGERGNLMAVERFANIAGYQTEIHKIDFNTVQFDPMDYDFILCPPGEIVSFPVILEWLKPYREKFEEYIKAKRPLFVTGTSVGLWGNKIVRYNGTEMECMGILPITTKENTAVYGDDIYFSCKYNGMEMEIIGNQIQMADFVNQGAEIFGHLHYGYGNTGKNRDEGFCIENAVFTNTLGPMLVTNPQLTTEIIKVIAGNRGNNIELIEYDDEIEKMSFKTKREFILSKESRLSNCK